MHKYGDPMDYGINAVTANFHRDRIPSRWTARLSGGLGYDHKYD
jgi:hypothetical protein